MESGFDKDAPVQAEREGFRGLPALPGGLPRLVLPTLEGISERISPLDASRLVLPHNPVPKRIGRPPGAKNKSAKAKLPANDQPKARGRVLVEEGSIAHLEQLDPRIKRRVALTEGDYAAVLPVDSRQPATWTGAIGDAIAAERFIMRPHWEIHGDCLEIQRWIWSAIEEWNGEWQNELKGRIEFVHQQYRELLQQVLVIGNQDEFVHWLHAGNVSVVSNFQQPKVSNVEQYVPSQLPPSSPGREARFTIEDVQALLESLAKMQASQPPPLARMQDQRYEAPQPPQRIIPAERAAELRREEPMGAIAQALNRAQRAGYQY